MGFTSFYSQAKILLVLILIIACSTVNGQIKSESANPGEIGMDTTGLNERFQFTFKAANPKAKKLMKEDFFWDPTAETAPFGSDEGSDAAYGFREWRASNKGAYPLIYLRELIIRWGYPYFDLYEMDTTKIKAFMKTDAQVDDSDMSVLKQNFRSIRVDTTRQISDSEINEAVKSAMKNMGASYLLGQDNAVIGTAFAQLVLEGYVAPDLKKLTIIAIQRELLPILINRYEVAYQKTRRAQLTKMLEVIRKCDSIK
jgi:uncharacterized protein YfeS